MNDRQLLEKAARDMVLDSLTDGGFSLDRVSNQELARVYDEVMAVDTSPRVQMKIAEEQIDPATRVVMEKAAEDTLLGRVAAQSYTVTYLDGVEKISQGMAGLVSKIRGRSPEEALALERAKREQEIELRPKEVESLQESPQSQRAGETLRQLQIKELIQRQQMAEELRRLQVQDQFDRRRREETMYQRLHPKPGGAFRSAVGGGLAGLAGGKILQGIASSGAAGAERLLPLSRRMGTVGALGGLGLGMLRGGPSRVVERLERERYVPSSMSGDVRMASAEKQAGLSTELLGNIMRMGRGSGISRVEGVITRLLREGRISEQQARQLLQTAPEAAGVASRPSQVFGATKPT